ncbi:MAG: transcriptional regulator SlyA [Acetobacteraceae bacterium]|nr:transcriptional regulator SlyA [Acetobacteraceae bacterium]
MSAQAQLRYRVGRTIGRVARRWRARLDARIAPFGLTESRWLVLLNLARYGDGVTQKELAARLAIEAPSLVRTLDWLEREGFVERRGVAHDRRSKNVHLTEKATPLVRRIEEVASKVRAEILDGIPEADLAICLSVLERAALNLAATPDTAAAAGPAKDRDDASRGHRAA